MDAKANILEQIVELLAKGHVSPLLFVTCEQVEGGSEDEEPLNEIQNDPHVPANESVEHATICEEWLVWRLPPVVMIHRPCHLQNFPEHRELDEKAVTNHRSSQDHQNQKKKVVQAFYSKSKAEVIHGEHSDIDHALRDGIDVEGCHVVVHVPESVLVICFHRFSAGLIARIVNQQVDAEVSQCLIKHRLFQYIRHGISPLLSLAESGGGLPS
jgi:hypothetical protein